MKKIRSSTTKSVAESWLKHFRRVAMTNRFAKGKKYDIIKTKRLNSLGFTITDYTIIEL
jgi:hypothetical protein